MVATDPIIPTRLADTDSVVARKSHGERQFHRIQTRRKLDLPQRATYSRATAQTLQ